MKYPKRSAFLSSARNDAQEEVDFREKAFGLIQTLTRLERTNPSVSIDRMDDYPAMHHEISDAHCISFVSTP